MIIRPPAQPAATDAASPERAKIRKAAEDFVAVALNELLEPMFDGTTDTQGLFGGGQGEEMFRPMLIEQTAKHMAASGGFGLTETVAASMLQLQEKKP